MTAGRPRPPAPPHQIGLLLDEIHFRWLRAAALPHPVGKMVEEALTLYRATVRDPFTLGEGPPLTPQRPPLYAVNCAISAAHWRGLHGVARARDGEIGRVVEEALDLYRDALPLARRQAIESYAALIVLPRPGGDRERRRPRR